MWILHAHQEPDSSEISKPLTATAFHLPTSQDLGLAALHKSSRHRIHHFFLPGLGLLSGSLWGVRKEGTFWLVCWGESLLPSRAHALPLWKHCCHQQQASGHECSGKKQTFTASEKQTAPVAPERQTSVFSEWVQKDLVHLLTRPYILSSGAFCLLFTCNFSKKPLCETGHTGDLCLSVLSLSLPPQ